MPGGEVSKPGEHHDVELEAAGVEVLLHNWSHSTEPTHTRVDFPPYILISGSFQDI